MDPFPQGPVWLPVPFSVSVGRSHGSRRLAFEQADTLHTQEVTRGRGPASACLALSEAACHLLTPVFLCGGGLFLHATAREQQLFGL